MSQMIENINHTNYSFHVMPQLCFILMKEGGKGYFRDPWSALFIPCEMRNGSWFPEPLWTVIFQNVLFYYSVKREILMLYFSWIVKGLFYFPWNVIYTSPPPPLPPSWRTLKVITLVRPSLQRNIKINIKQITKQIIRNNLFIYILSKLV